MSRVSIVAAALLGLIGPASAVAATYTYATVDAPEAIFNHQPPDISKAGPLAGDHRDGIFGPAFHELLSNGTFTTVDNPTAQPGDTTVLGINDRDVMVGAYFTTSGRRHGFMYDGVTFRTIDDPLDVPRGAPGHRRGTIGADAYHSAVLTTAGHAQTVGAVSANAIVPKRVAASRFRDAVGNYGFSGMGGVFNSAEGSAGNVQVSLVDAGSVSSEDRGRSGDEGLIDDGAFIPLDQPEVSTPGPALLALGDIDADPVAPPTALPTPSALGLLGLSLLFLGAFRARTILSAAPSA